MSWKPAVATINSNGKFHPNNLAFATKEEALESARDLMQRWLLVTDYRAEESNQPVNARLTDGKLTLLETNNA
jgi:hypothetical protein